MASNLFELELEGLDHEQAEFEAARRVVQLAAAAAQHAALAPPDAPAAGRSPPGDRGGRAALRAGAAADAWAAAGHGARAPAPYGGGGAAERPLGSPRPQDHPPRRLRRGPPVNGTALARRRARAGGAGAADAARPRQAVRAAGDDAARGRADAGGAARDRALPDRQPLPALRNEVLAYLRWLRQPARRTPPAEMQRRFTVVRLRFNDALTQFDLFSELITQRSEHDTGVWLAGLDVLAARRAEPAGRRTSSSRRSSATSRAGRAPRSGAPGRASRAAGRTRWPIVRVPRERMVGHGIASSLVHEVGHQAAALLGLVESLRPVAPRAQRPRGTRTGAARVGLSGSAGSRRSSPTSGRSRSSGSARRSA